MTSVPVLQPAIALVGLSFAVLGVLNWEPWLIIVGTILAAVGYIATPEEVP